MIEPVHECVKADCAEALPPGTSHALWQAGTIYYIRQLGLCWTVRRLRLGVKEVLQGCSSGNHLHGSPTIVVIFLLMRLINLRRHFASPIYIFFSPTHMAIWAASGSNNTELWNCEYYKMEPWRLIVIWHRCPNSSEDNIPVGKLRAPTDGVGCQWYPPTRS